MMEMKGKDRQIVLLGNPDTKRTIYFEHAARQTGLHVFLLKWEHLDTFMRENAGRKMLMKIDPPLWDSCRLEELNTLAEDYGKQLKGLSGTDREQVWFFNDPGQILALLDKRGCKKKLLDAGLPVTQEVGNPDAGHLVSDAESLLELMSGRKIYQVFIKPVNGSGAAGIAAFRFQPKTGRMVLYTCALEHPADGLLVNTKRLRCFSGRSGEKGGQVFSLLNRILALGCIVERWYAKAEYEGYSYDLRAVVQEGRMDYLLARLSKGPITNLHLNNRPLPAPCLNLPEPVLASVEALCQRACGCFPGMNSVGMDILLERRSLTPRIIEMNGQGDLLYQDIYRDNRIYLHQAGMMKRWLDEGIRACRIEKQPGSNKRP